MIERQRDKSCPSRADGPARREEELPYRIELWDAADRTAVERVLARAVSAQLARAIFQAAQTEHPDRRITLCRGARVIADSAK
jgi:hypothetical protein